LHALTTSDSRTQILQNTREVAAAYIASGINPKKTIIFVQSNVTGHSELAWILSCHTPIGWLNRMTQFKDKAGKNKERAPLGLYSYPVLMAADILLYKSTHVPVGDDQKQHLELSRDIAQAFNRYYQNDFFPIPEPIITGNATRVMSLRDGLKKMSKSDPSDQSRINLSDNSVEMEKKIQKAKTDSHPFPENFEGLDGRPEIKNLINIFSALNNESVDKIISNYVDKDFKIFKKDLSDLLVEKISLISSEMKKLLKNEDYLDSILKDGNLRANEMANKNLTKLKNIMGLFKS
jgi:tryptophanyl-tRNA synthetase